MVDGCCKSSAELLFVASKAVFQAGDLENTLQTELPATAYWQNYKLLAPDERETGAMERVRNDKLRMAH